MQLGENLFLEAHYYSNGVRYKSIPGIAERPLWAGEARQTGIKNDFRMRSGMVAIEYSRIQTGNQVADWIAVFFPSADVQLGNRSNYAGIGLWSCGYRYSDVSNLLDGLAKLGAHIAKSMGVDEALEANAETFLNKYLLRYLVSDNEVPRGISPLPPSTSRPATRIEVIRHFAEELDTIPEPIKKSVSDRISVANFASPPNGGFSRLLIVLGSNSDLDEQASFQEFDFDINLGSELLQILGKSERNAIARLEEYKTKNAEVISDLTAAQSRVAELEANEEMLKSEVENFKELNRALEDGTAISPELRSWLEKLDQKIDGVQEMLEPAANNAARAMASIERVEIATLNLSSKVQSRRQDAQNSGRREPIRANNDGWSDINIIILVITVVILFISGIFLAIRYI